MYSIMKTDFKASTFYVKRDDRIKAQIATLFNFIDEIPVT
jgi:hypothetical protein